MFTKSIVQESVALVVSAMMAFPASVWARDTSVSGEATKDGAPVFLQPMSIQLQDGRTVQAYWAAAPVAPKLEPEVIKNLPKDSIVAVSGMDDPGVRALRSAYEAYQQGNPDWLNTFIVADPHQAVALQSKKWGFHIHDLGQRTMKAIKDFAFKEKSGLLTVLYVTSLDSGYVLYETGAVAAGMKAFIALFAWAGFQGMFTHAWDRYLEKGASIGRKMLVALNTFWGRDVSEREARMYEVAGKFHASWLANVAVDSFVLLSAGTWEGLLYAMWLGFVSSYDLIDPSLSQRVKEGKLRDIMFRRFVLLRILAGSLFELAAFLGVPHVQLALALVTFGAITYLAVGRYLENLANKANKALEPPATKRKECEYLLME